MRELRTVLLVPLALMGVLLSACSGGQDVSLAVPVPLPSTIIVPQVPPDKVPPQPPEQAPNLTPKDDLTARVADDGSIALVVTLHNGGGRTPVASRLAFLLVGEDDQETVLESVNVPAMEAGADLQLRATIPAGRVDPDDNLVIKVDADADNQVTESDEDDNEAEVELAYGTDIDVTGARIAGGNAKVTIKADVTNVGNLPTGSFGVKAQFKLEDNGGGGGNYADVPGAAKQLNLKPDEKQSVEFVVELKPEYTGKIVDLQIVADADKAIKELDEENNSDNADWFVTPGGTTPTPSPSPGTPSPGTPPPTGTKADLTVAAIVDITDAGADNYVLLAGHGNLGPVESGPFIGQWTIKTPNAGAITPANGQSQNASVKSTTELVIDPAGAIRWKPSDDVKGKIVTFEYEADAANTVAEETDGQPNPPEIPKDRFASTKGNGLNNTYRFDVAVPADPPVPDLAVEMTAELSKDKKEIHAFGYIQNLGTGRSKPVTYQWYLNDRKWKGEFKLKNPLPAGKRHGVTPLEAKIPEGAKDKVEVRLVARPTGPDAEPKNDKEQHTLDLDRRGPLLTVTSCTVYPRRSNPDLQYCDLLIVHGRIKNIGDQSSKKFGYSATVNGKKEKEKATKKGLKAHRSRVFKLRVPLAQGVAEKPIKVAFNLEDAKPTPARAVKRDALVVVKGLPKAEERRFDLRVSAARFRAEGGKRFLEATVANNGPHTSTAFAVKWFVDGEEIVTEKAHAALKKGQKATVQYELKNNEPNYDVLLQAPPSADLIGDINPQNNYYVGKIAVRKP